MEKSIEGSSKIDNLMRIMALHNLALPYTSND